MSREIFPKFQYRKLQKYFRNISKMTENIYCQEREEEKSLAISTVATRSSSISTWWPAGSGSLRAIESGSGSRTVGKGGGDLKVSFSAHLRCLGGGCVALTFGCITDILVFLREWLTAYRVTGFFISFGNLLKLRITVILR